MELNFVLICCRIQYLFKPKPGKQHQTHNFYRTLFPKIIQDIEVCIWFYVDNLDKLMCLMKLIQS